MKTSPILLLIVLLLIACHKNKHNSNNEKPAKAEVFSDFTISNETNSEPGISVPETVLQKIHTDTVQFKEFNDGGDNFLFIVTKGKQEIALIYKDDMLNRNDFVRGDKVMIEWELDSIRNAGDDEVVDFVKRLRKAEKIKEGKVSVFRKEYGKTIAYTPNKAEDNYSDSFIDEARTIVEYIVAGSRAETLQKALSTQEAKLFYTIKEAERENKMYYVFHISSKMDGQLKDIQQIYQEVETGVLFEYDPVTDSLMDID